MEYRIEATGHLADEDILKAVKAFLNPASGNAPGFHPSAGPIDHPISGRATAGRSTNSAGHPSGKPITLGPAGLPKPGQRPGMGPNTFAHSSPASAAHPAALRFVPLSNWGGTDHYYFWLGNRKLLSIGRRASHPQWTNMVTNWHRPISFQAISTQPVATLTVRPGGSGKPVSQMSDTEKLTEAMQRALPKIPEQAKKAVKELLTPANFAIFVGMTVVLMSSGVGEVLGLGLLVIGAVAGGIDLCVNVLRMVFDFYRKATGAQSEQDLDDAADLFARIVLRGGVDLLDILVGRRAAAKLAGRGLSSVGAYFGYLEEEMKLWRARQAGGGAIKQGAATVKEAENSSQRPKEALTEEVANKTGAKLSRSQQKAIASLRDQIAQWYGRAESDSVLA